MLPSLGVLFMLVATCTCDWLPALTRPQMETKPVAQRFHHTEFGLSDYSSGLRRKRGVGRVLLGMAIAKGQRARNILLKGATPVKNEVGVRTYEKSGGIQKMVKDFESVTPYNVHINKIGNKNAGRVGRVGDMDISYDTGLVTGKPTLTLVKKKNTKESIDIIEYKN